MTSPLRGVRRSELRRDTLIRNLKRAIARAHSENLPATIKEVYAFGGILRGKEKAHDFDAIFLYDQTPEQKARWERFMPCFGNYPLNKTEKMLGIDQVRNQVYAILRPCYEQGISLRKTATLDSVAEELKSLDIEPSWVGCFSWTEVFYNPFGIFIPNIQKVLRSRLCRGMRGLQVFFEKHDNFKQGSTWLRAKNYRLAWSPEKPDIEKNLKMQPEEKVVYLTNELKIFIEQIVQLKEDFSEVLNELAALSQNMGVKINFEGLTSKHVDVSYSENEPHDQLRVKCEQARQEMRAYNEETTVLRNLIDSTRSLQERINDPFFSKHPPQDWIAYWTILRTPRSYVKEGSTREILKNLGLPENHVVTIKHVGYTRHKLEPDESKRKELLKQAETAEKKRKLTFKLRKIVRKLQPRATVYIHLIDEAKVVHFEIYSEPTKDDKTNELFMREWEKRGFKTTKSPYTLSASKSFELTGKETLSDVEQRLIEALDSHNHN